MFEREDPPAFYGGLGYYEDGIWIGTTRVVVVVVVLVSLPSTQFLLHGYFRGLYIRALLALGAEIKGRHIRMFLPYIGCTPL